MPAGMAHRRLVLAAGLASYALVFTAFVLFEIPGLGIAHFFYLSVALVAVVTGPGCGVWAGVLADGLWALGIYLNANIPTADIYTTSTGIRFVTFTAVGGLVGWFAKDNRRLVEHLQTTASRDFLTDLLNSHAFDETLVKRLESRRPFGLILGDMDRLKEINDEEGHAVGNELLRRAAQILQSVLRAEDALGRVGGDEFAVLTSLPGTDAVRALCGRLTNALADEGIAMSFGWAVHPRDGGDPVTLFRAADERLFARKLIRSRLTGGDVVELPREHRGYSIGSGR
ncbi:MAG: GGDEF domain-containing protein [Gaiellaceae bacterium]